MMIKTCKYLVLIFLSCSFFRVSAQQDLFKQLEDNIKAYYIYADKGASNIESIVKGTENVEDQKTKELALINKFNKSFNANGSWTDINYQDNKKAAWAPREHADRLLALSMIYSNPQSAFYQSKALKETLHKALDFWFKAKLVSSNWWYNEIGIPKTLGVVFILLKHELSAEEKQYAVEILNKSSFKQTGQNKVWQAGNIFYKAILIEDEALAKRARDTIFSELRMTTEEGIQPDYSFHQHGPQLQFGNYGQGFVTTMSFWARICSSTPLQLDDEKLIVLRNLILEGFNWVIWKGYFDINSLGRQFAKKALTSKSSSLAGGVLDMIDIDPANAALYKKFITNNYKAHQPSSLIGNRCFWRSDMTIHRQQHWMSSVKMSSERVQATEALNGENLKGYHIGDGTHFIYVKGDEYDDIFPVWNWKKLPGVTNYQNPKPLPVLTISGFRNKGDFTGGVSNGKAGLTAFMLNRDSLTGNKAWFHLEDKIVCLGAAIKPLKQDSVFTTLNQVYVKGPIVYQHKKRDSLGQGERFSSSTVKWVYHHHIGYVPLNGTSLTLTNQKQRGSWGEIAVTYGDEKAQEAQIFTIEVEHGKEFKQSSYAYMILPHTTLNQVENSRVDFEIIANDKKAQVVWQKNKQQAYFAIYEPQNFNIKGFVEISFKSPGLYMLSKNGKQWVLNSADPTQKQEILLLKVNQKEIRVKMLNDGYKGKTVETIFN
jgi:chondroitin AC lyase